MATKPTTLPDLRALRAWLADAGAIETVEVTHAILAQQQSGPPLLHPKRSGLLPPESLARLRASLAVERCVYAGLASRYRLANAADRDALLHGLAHGFRFDDLRITDGSLTDCVEANQWAQEGCDCFEFVGGAWHPLDPEIRKGASGKSDDEDDDRSPASRAETLFVPIPLRPADAPPMPSPRGYVGDVLDALERAGIGGRQASTQAITVTLRGATGAASIEIHTAAAAAELAASLAGSGEWAIPAMRPESVPLLPTIIWPNGPGTARAYDTATQWAP